MFRWRWLDIPTRLVVILTVLATITVGGRGIYAMIHTDGLNAWITTGLMIGIPAGWAWIATAIHDKEPVRN
jgi:hypothetical protein